MPFSIVGAICYEFPGWLTEFGGGKVGDYPNYSTIFLKIGHMASMNRLLYPSQGCALYIHFN